MSPELGSNYLIPARVGRVTRCCSPWVHALALATVSCAWHDLTDSHMYATSDLVP